MRRLILLLSGVLFWSGCSRQSGAGLHGESARPDAEVETRVRFEDVTERSGVRFTHFTGADGRYRMPESIGPGCALFDFDGDGWLDLFLVNSTNWPDRAARGATCALYRNLRDGTFREVTREAGLSVSMYGQGCAVGDFDNDGRDDLFITCLGQNRLFANLGNGRFRDVTRTSGLLETNPWRWHTSAAWLDYDRDGRLDLFVCRYVRWTPDTNSTPRSTGKPTYSGPEHYLPERSALYRNLGGGRFQDVSTATGIAAAPAKALGVVALDEDQDGWTDLLVTNDTMPNQLFHNERGKGFREVALETGVAVGETGKPRAGMGIDVADISNDGGLAFGIGNFSGEGLALFRKSMAVYRDDAAPTGLTPASYSRLTFGLVFLDADRDGWQDLFTYNGHVDPRVADKGEQVTYQQSPQFFRNRAGRLLDETSAAGPALQVPQVGRGCAWGDLDNDGQPDLVLCENGGPTRIIRNTSPDPYHWLGVRLQGSRMNRNAYGAEVRAVSKGMVQRRWVRSGGSFLSHSDTRALFGLGRSAELDRLEVHWPGGRVTTIERPPVNRYFTLTAPGP